MKKFLSTVSLGLIVGFSSAFAGAPQIQIERNNLPVKEIKKVNSAVSAEQIKSIPIGQNSRRAVKNKIATLEDFCGVYDWSGKDRAEAYQFGRFSIQEDPDNPEKVRIYNFDPYIDYLEGYVANGRLYIPEQYETLDVVFGHLVFTNCTVNLAGVYDGVAAYYLCKTDKEFYFTLDEEGNIYAGTPIDNEIWEAGGYTDAQLEDMVCVASSVLTNYDPDGDGGLYGYWFCMWIHGEKLNFPKFEYDEAEWEHVGTALLQEPWSTIWYDVERPEYEVELYRSKTENTTYLLMHPFGEYTPWGEFTASADPGHIVFSIGNPDCVVVHPRVYSFSTPSSEDDETELFEIYCYNQEGYDHFINFIGTEHISDNYKYLNMETSWFDAKTRTVHLYNARFNFGVWYDSYYFYDDPTGYIILPEGYSSNAVEAIDTDDSNVPEEYYNLQGLKLQTPEKGQVVIVRKGNKASKMVVR